jgi:hypothetical protein
MTKPTTAAIILLFVIAFASCSGKSDNKVIGLLQNSLNSSNTTINISTQALLIHLEDKTIDPCSKESAKFWFPKAKTIVIKTKTLYDFLETEKSKKGLSSHDKALIADNLVEFRDRILSIDSQFIEISEKNFAFIKNFIWISGGDTLSKTNSFNSNTVHHSSTAILTMLQNEIKKTENRMIAFCNAKVGCIGGGLTSYSSIIGQNSTILRHGETLEIVAGVGVYNSPKPTIIINGQNITIGEEGFSIFKTKTPKTPGHYSIPVQIKYFNTITGKEENIQKNVEYTVAKECDQ